jgi:pilus assembly protein Flp/PilA
MALWQRLLCLPYAHRWKRGQGLVEYALILVFVAVVVIVILVALGPSIQDVYQNIIDNL